LACIILMLMCALWQCIKLVLQCCRRRRQHVCDDYKDDILVLDQPSFESAFCDHQHGEMSVDALGWLTLVKLNRVSAIAHLLVLLGRPVPLCLRLRCRLQLVTRRCLKKDSTEMR
jgi:hypothetical protein